MVANSLFNDTFTAKLQGVNETKDFMLTNEGIAWKTDKHRYKPTKYNASQIVPPPNWAKKFPNGYTDENIPDLQNWEEFKVWMRTAALPKFYKLALMNETSELPEGMYETNITLNYPVLSFNGEKAFVLTTNSIIGARNVVLGILYLIVAGICTLFAIIFLTKVIFQPRSLTDHSYLNYTPQQFTMANKQQQPQQPVFNNIPLREIL